VRITNSLQPVSNGSQAQKSNCSHPLKQHQEALQWSVLSTSNPCRKLACGYKLCDYGFGALQPHYSLLPMRFPRQTGYLLIHVSTFFKRDSTFFPTCQYLFLNLSVLFSKLVSTFFKRDSMFFPEKSRKALKNSRRPLIEGRSPYSCFGNAVLSAFVELDRMTTRAETWHVENLRLLPQCFPNEISLF